jgi:tetratricopeptide (TPR) repeat protein
MIREMGRVGHTIMKVRKKTLWVILFIIISVLAAFAVYYNALGNGFIWDDPIVLKRQVSAFRSATDIFFPPAGIPQFGLHYYRPLVMLSYIVDEAIWGKTPFGFHLTVVLLHLVNTILIFFLCQFILKKFEYGPIGAFIGALVFAVHPIHTESVAWMAGRSDTMAATFFFLSLFFYLKFKEKRRGYWLVLSTGVFLLAALAKEVSLSLVLLLPFIDMAFFSEEAVSSEPTAARHERRRKKRTEKKRKKREKERTKDKPRMQEKTEAGQMLKSLFRGANILSYFPFVLATLVYLVVRNQALGEVAKRQLQTFNILKIARNLINSYGFYMEKLFAPTNLKAFIPEIPSSLLYTLLSIAAVFLLGAGIIFSLQRKNRVIFFAIIFFFLTLAPSIMVAVMKISETPLAERYLYIPSLSFSLLIGYVFLYVPLRLGESARMAAYSRWIIALLILVLLAVFSIMTVKRNTIWKDDILFWEDLVRKTPDQGLPHLNLGLAYSENDRPEDAEREYRLAIESKYDDEGRSTAYNNLGNIYLNKKDFDNAEHCFKTAISTRRNYPTPYYSMGLSLFRRYVEAARVGKRPDIKLIEEAMQYLGKAIKLNPQYVKAHSLLGDILFRFGRFDEARKHLETALMYEKEGKSANAARKLLEKINSREN